MGSLCLAASGRLLSSPEPVGAVRFQKCYRSRGTFNSAARPPQPATRAARLRPAGAAEALTTSSGSKNNLSLGATVPSIWLTSSFTVVRPIASMGWGTVVSGVGAAHKGG